MKPLWSLATHPCSFSFIINNFVLDNQNHFKCLFLPLDSFLWCLETLLKLVKVKPYLPREASCGLLQPSDPGLGQISPHWLQWVQTEADWLIRRESLNTPLRSVTVLNSHSYVTWNMFNKKWMFTGSMLHFFNSKDCVQLTESINKDKETEFRRAFLKLLLCNKSFQIMALLTHYCVGNCPSLFILSKISQR